MDPTLGELTWYCRPDGANDGKCITVSLLSSEGDKSPLLSRVEILLVLLKSFIRFSGWLLGWADMVGEAGLRT